MCILFEYLHHLTMNLRKKKGTLVFVSVTLFPPTKTLNVCLLKEQMHAPPALVLLLIQHYFGTPDERERLRKKKNPDSIGDVQLSSWMSEPQKNDDVFSKDIPQEKRGIFNKKFLCKT